MNTEQATEGRRFLRRYTVEEREQLIREQAESGMTKKAFCKERGIHVSTFHGWRKDKQEAGGLQQLAEVEVVHKAAPVELVLPGGRRLGIYIHDEASVVRLIRGVMAC